MSSSTEFKTLGSNGTSNPSAYVQVSLLFIAVLLSTRILLRRVFQSDKDRRREKMVNMFPGPPHYPLVGHITEIFKLAWNPKKNLLKWLVYAKDKYGLIYRGWLFNQPRIVICCSDTAIELYRNDQLQGKSTDVTVNAKKLGGEGLLAVPAHKHGLRRKMWNPSFSRKQVEYSTKFFRIEAIKLRNALEQFAGDGNREGEVVNLLERTIGCTFGAVCYSAFGEDYMNKLSHSAGKEHMNALHTIAVNLTSRIFRPWLSNDFFYYYCTAEGRETLRCIEVGNSLAKQAIKDRKKQREEIQWQNKISNNNNFKFESNDAKSFLDHVLDLLEGGYLTEKEVVDELNVFIAAGYDTSGIAICFALYLLSLYPEHQEKVVKELYEVLNISTTAELNNCVISAADTKQMKHLDLCIKEALRLYPVLPISPRRSVDDIILPDGKVIPEGVDIQVVLSIIHKDPKYFPDPDAFIPERHLEHIPAFMPFTTGSRNCVGQVYAMYEMKIVLSYLLLAYEFKTIEKPDIDVIFQTLQVPENGMRFTLTKRTVKQ